LVDRSPLTVVALDPTDQRSVVVNVAGEAALLVAKLHKLGDRLQRPDRLQAKDAGDVYRLFDNVDSIAMASRMRSLLDDERSARTAQRALEFGDTLFDGPRAIGIELALTALRGVLPCETVSTTVTAYWRSLAELLR
jgi:hypothetical protein